MHHTSVTLADLSFPLFSIFEIIKHGWLKNCCHVFIVYYLYNLVKIRCLLYLSLYTNDIPHGVISGFIFSINQSVMSLPNLEVLKLNRCWWELLSGWSIYISVLIIGRLVDMTPHGMSLGSLCFSGKKIYKKIQQVSNFN